MMSDWEEDNEDPSSADIDRDDSVDVTPCPYCRKPVYHDAELCPHCGSYISDEDSRPPRKPAWYIIGVIVTLLLILLCWVLTRSIS